MDTSSTNEKIQINHVSDTALWVAYYRAKETLRPDALFRDPLANVLLGERGKKIAESMKTVGKYTEWAVIARTVIIDQFILDLIGKGVDTVINMGTGLDTRPYRMNLPSSLKWIEVDYPQIISHKNRLLKKESPKCQLTRVELDLADEEKRNQFLTEVGSQAKKTLVITEGVIPYLSEEQVSSLAKALHNETHVHYWITEFFRAEVYPYLKASLRTIKMKNAPFRFFPNDWLGFFEKCGWTSEEIRYSTEIAVKYNRKIPLPWWAGFLRIFFSKAIVKKSEKMSGYMVFKKISY